MSLFQCFGLHVEERVLQEGFRNGLELKVKLTGANSVVPEEVQLGR